ncbi:MAG TPA: rhodanese-like domain-containing protein [Armatimonadota bacterium]|nr:rhodanese-like domain-containing protein [Armatimonadota bacterium]
MRRRVAPTLCLVLAVLSLLTAGCGPFDWTIVHEVSPAQLQALMDDGLPLQIIDVRTPAEFAAGHIHGSVNRPLADLDTWAAGIDTPTRICVVCQIGARSATAAEALVARGFSQVYALAGGLAAWPGQLVTS